MAKLKRRRLDSADDAVGAAQGCPSGTRFGQRFGVGSGGFGGRSRRRGRLAIRLPLTLLVRLLPLLERLLLGDDRRLYLLARKSAVEGKSSEVRVCRGGRLVLKN